MTTTTTTNEYGTDFSDIVPNFGRGIHEVPNETWTVEELFQWTLIQSLTATDAKCQETITSLQQGFEEGLQQVLKEYQAQHNSNNDENFQHNNNNNNQDDNHNKNAVSGVVKPNVETNNNNNTVAPSPASLPKKTTNHPPKKFPVTLYLQITALTGPHADKTFPDVKLTASQPVWVGRSKGKKYKDGKGVSLSKDVEVSTQHGKFIYDNKVGIVSFVDTESTNGTKAFVPHKTSSPTASSSLSYPSSSTLSSSQCKEIDLEPNDPLVMLQLAHQEVLSKCVLVCGQSQLQVQLVE